MWWFRCENMYCQLFGGLFAGKYIPGTPFLCPQCDKKCRREEPFGNGPDKGGYSSSDDSADSGEEEDDDLSDDEYVHKKIVKVETITDVHPRCEYNTRLIGSTAFEMEEPKHWDTYSRSTSSRLNQTFKPKGFTKDKIMGLHSKTGTYQNVFGFAPEYRRIVKVKEKTKEDETPPPSKSGSGFVYQKFLEYRTASCRYLLDVLREEGCPSDIVNADDDYPCVLVLTPGAPKNAPLKNNKKLKFWTRLVMAFYVGIANYYAWNRGIPIEIVMRSSFAHITPSIAECGISFRISVGIVPREYLDVLARAVVKVHEVFDGAFKRKLSKLSVSEGFTDLSEPYFFAVLARRIGETEAPPMKQLKKEMEEHGEDWVKKKYLKSTQKLPVRLREGIDNLWDWLWSPGDAMGKTVLAQIVDRHQDNLEEIADRVQEALQDQKNVAETMKTFPERFKLQDGTLTVTTKPRPERLDFEKVSPRGQRQIFDDDFWDVIRLMMYALGGGEDAYKEFAGSRTVGGLHAYLESLNMGFIKKVAPRFLSSSEDGTGSDSEEEEDVDEGVRIYSKKIITATGMRAIQLSHYCGRLCASKGGLKVTNVKATSERMYYETSEALSKAFIEPLVTDKKSGSLDMLFFDLNHCNTMHKKYPKIDFGGFDVVVLDHTSSTPQLVNVYLEDAFRSKKVQVVLLVASGLKNEQSGSDMNTYGTIRIMTRDKSFRDQLHGALLKAEEGYKHPKESHAIRKAYRSVGFVPTTKSFLKPGFSTPPRKTTLTQQLEYRTPQGSTVTFDVIDVEADGDCLFGAISAAGQPLAGPGSAIRSDVHTTLSFNQRLVPEGMYLQVGLGFSYKHTRSREEYLSAMKEALVWGGLPEIKAYSMRRPIIVFETPRTPRLFRNGVELTTIDWSNLPPFVIFIAFYGNHYVALRKR